MVRTNLQFEIGNAHNAREQERGISLLLALLILLIVSAVGLGLLAMSDTETAVNSNYKDTQLAFFAMRSGLEEVRDRMRVNAVDSSGTNISIDGGNCTTSPCLPSVMPGNTNSVLYITNPAAGETVTPTSTTGGSNPEYFDDEFCHEHFYSTASGGATILTDTGTGIPCTTTANTSWVMTHASVSPGTGTAAALKFKWVRVTLKQNGSIPNAVVDSTQGLGVQVCYQTSNNQEIPLTLVPGYATYNYANCAVAQASGQDAGPVYLVTALAVTSQGTRRIGQYEVSRYTITPPATGLGLDGPGSNINGAPNSNNFCISGLDISASNPNDCEGNVDYPYPGPGSCTPTTVPVPAISTTSNADVTNVASALPRPNMYTGLYYTAAQSPPAPDVANGPPSVINEGPSPGLGGLTGIWSNVTQLNNLMSTIANVADVTISGCSTNGSSPCTPSQSSSGTLGTNAKPQITYVNGDFNLGSSSGAGILAVTGNLSASGVPSFNGLILVIGQGSFSAGGGGSATFNGSLFLANTNSHSSPYAPLATLGAAAFHWNGGGKNAIQYNSCWANYGNQLEYNVLATREEMY